MLHCALSLCVMSRARSQQRCRARGCEKGLLACCCEWLQALLRRLLCWACYWQTSSGMLPVALLQLPAAHVLCLAATVAAGLGSSTVL